MERICDSPRMGIEMVAVVAPAAKVTVLVVAVNSVPATADPSVVLKVTVEGRVVSPARGRVSVTVPGALSATLASPMVTVGNGGGGARVASGVPVATTLPVGTMLR